MLSDGEGASLASLPEKEDPVSRTKKGLGVTRRWSHKKRDKAKDGCHP